MQYANSIIETIGNTPLVKLNNIVKNKKNLFLAKLESFNPGNSIKDRVALNLIEDAEKKGLLKKHSTIVEGTSGNTGMGLALVAITKGYKLICVTTDKQSKEKTDILKAVGAKVIVCPTDVEASNPKSYYSVSKHLSKEIPDAWLANQYHNPANPETHFMQTGPEIWKQTNGRITHFVAGVGTGGTISGVGQFLKSKNKNIKILGVDTYGSVLKKYHETGVFDENEIYPYITEGIGEDIIPENIKFSVIDKFVKVTDKNAALYTRRLAKEEGLFCGNSSGAAVYASISEANFFEEGSVIVILLPDHGSRYVAKIYNDSWMKSHDFI